MSNICEFCQGENKRRGRFCSIKCSRAKYHIDNKIERNEKSLKYYYNNPNWFSENYKKNKIRENQRGKKWRSEHPDYMKEWQLKNEEELILYRESRKLINKDYNRDYVNERRKEDINFRIKDNLRTRIYSIIKNHKKSASTEKLIGCTTDFFIKHIESLFLKGMSWENYGSEWEVDHIISCHTFDLEFYEQQQECFNYNNQRPLWKTTKIASIYGCDMIGNRNREKSRVKTSV